MSPIANLLPGSNFDKLPSEISNEIWKKLRPSSQLSFSLTTKVSQESYRGYRIWEFSEALKLHFVNGYIYDRELKDICSLILFPLPSQIIMATFDGPKPVLSLTVAFGLFLTILKISSTIESRERNLMLGGCVCGAIAAWHEYGGSNGTSWAYLISSISGVYCKSSFKDNKCLSVAVGAGLMASYVATTSSNSLVAPACAVGLISGASFPYLWENIVEPISPRVQMFASGLFAAGKESISWGENLAIPKLKRAVMTLSQSAVTAYRNFFKSL